METFGLALLYPALEWSGFAPGHHGYPRAPDLILGKAANGRSGYQITGTTAAMVRSAGRFSPLGPLGIAAFLSGHSGA